MALSKNGMSLVAVLITISLAAVAALGISQVLSSMFKQQARLTSKNDIESIRLGLLQAINCENTFTLNSINLTSDCDLTATPKPIRLFNRNSQPLSPVLETAGTFANAGEVAKGFFVRTYCDAVKKTLFVSIAKSDKAGNFARDLATKQEFDYTRPPNPLFGGTGAAICSEKFTVGTPVYSCTPPQVVASVNPATNEVTCTTPAAGNVLNYVQATAPLFFTSPNCNPSAAASATYIASVNCPAGYVLMGGGSFATGGNAPGCGAFLLQSNISGPSSYAIAYCISCPSASNLVNPWNGGHGVATCLRAQ